MDYKICPSGRIKQKLKKEVFMERVIQRVESFFALGTLGAEGGKRTLESVIFRMNSDGWRVDQIVPISFQSSHIDASQISMTSGVILCSMQ